jgi:hypothetical protein
MSIKCCLRQRAPLWWLAPPPSPPLRGGTMGVGQWRPFECMAAAERKPYNRASPGKTSKPGCTRGNAPLLPTAPPPEGEVLAPLYLEMLMSSEAERRAKFPLRGKGGALAPKGVHFHALCTFCRECASQSKLAHSLHIKGLSYESLGRCRRRGCKGFPAAAGGIYIYCRGSGNPQPSGHRPVKLSPSA